MMCNNNPCTFTEALQLAHLPCRKQGAIPVAIYESASELASTHQHTEVCQKVKIEPNLQPVTGEQFILASSNTDDGAHWDIAANGFWEGRC